MLVGSIGGAVVSLDDGTCDLAPKLKQHNQRRTGGLHQTKDLLHDRGTVETATYSLGEILANDTYNSGLVHKSRTQSLQGRKTHFLL